MNLADAAVEIVRLAGRIAFRIGPALHQVPEDAGGSETEHRDHVNHDFLRALSPLHVGVVRGIRRSC